MICATQIDLVITSKIVVLKGVASKAIVQISLVSRCVEEPRHEGATHFEKVATKLVDI